MIKHCTVYYNRIDAVSRILTGFHMLEKNGILNVEYIENSNDFRKMANGGGPIIEVEMDGKIMAFDMGDRWALSHEEGREYLNRIDKYFARDYSNKIDIVTPVIFTGSDKVKPYGFNYYTTFPNNPLDIPKTTKHRIKYKTKKLTGYNKCMYPEYFEGKANEKKKDFTIIFMARLWDDSDIVLDSNLPKDIYEYREYMISERNRINQSRISIMRYLKKEYGKFFIGGMYHDSYSERMCPDLIVPNALVRKKAYLDKMKKADICIGSMGLHRSIGWKMGEYVAAARAIVAERLEYIVPGDFDDGHHYIPFDTNDECFESVAKLYDNPDLIFSMKKANENYYKEYLKPDVQILNAFREAGIK